MHRCAILFLLALLAQLQLGAATATATLQVIWPEDMLGLDQDEAFNQALSYLQGEDYVNQAVRMPDKWKEKLANASGVNSYRNTDALAQAARANLAIQGDAARHVISLSFTCSDAEVAQYMAQRCADVAAKESHYKIAEKMDPDAARIAQQMEQIQDNIQQLQQQIRVTQMQKRMDQQTRGASIGAPVGMGRVVHPAETQQRAQEANLREQIQSNQKQYNELAKQLNQAVAKAWQGKSKIGLVVVDHADLDEG